MIKRTGEALALLLTPFCLFLGSTGLDSRAIAADDAGSSSGPAPIVQLRGVVHHGGDHLGMPVGLAAVGTTLVAIDRYGEHSIHVVDLRTGELRGSIGRKGEGPGEFEAPYSIDRTSVADELWVFDAGLQRLTRVDLTALDSDGSWAREFISLRGSARVMNPVHTAAGNLLAIGFFAEGRFGVFDQRGAQVDALGALPEWSESIPPGVLQHAFTGTIKSDPDRRRFAVGARHAGLLEIFDANGERVARARVPVEFEPRFTVNVRENGPPSMGSGDDMRFGYVDVAATKDRIYGLFSGRVRGEYPKSATYAREIHVFDWGGRLEKVLRLDADVIAIAVDERDATLYAIGHDPLPAILKYALTGAGGPQPVGSIALRDG
jgi:hypothetical protein